MHEHLLRCHPFAALSSLHVNRNDLDEEFEISNEIAEVDSSVTSEQDGSGGPLVYDVNVGQNVRSNQIGDESGT